MDVPTPGPVAARLRAAGCVFAEEEATLLLAEAPDPDRLADWIDRRVAGEPLEQIVGWALFHDLRIPVEAGVFVPRRRTEILVREALAALRANRAGAGGRAGVQGVDDDPGGPRRRPVVVDLCCGSGAVGIAIARVVDVDLHAVDIEEVAVRRAGRTAEELLGGPGRGSGARVYLGDLDAPLPRTLRGRVDVLTANAPYVPTDEIALMPPEAREHEPRVTLDGGADGVDLHRRVAVLAPGWLAVGGTLLVETSRRQAPRTLDAVEGAGLAARIVRDEESDATAVVGTWAGNPG